MVNARNFVISLQEQGVAFFSGVPDSLLKHFCTYLGEALSSREHMIACNEGAAVALALGHHLATGMVPLVYLQNSGLGNVVGAMTSLTHTDVYSVPMILLIGWRGEMIGNVQKADEPQHVKQGRCTLQQLELLDIPTHLLDASVIDVPGFTGKVVAEARQLCSPVAIVVRRDTFEGVSHSRRTGAVRTLSREQLIETCVTALGASVPLICTTGMASRELYEVRFRHHQGHERDFLTVGGMGLASSIAIGVANAMPARRVACIDGDGALLMHMGAMAYCARLQNLVHIVVNNGAHDSVGAQPTLATDLDLSSIASSFGYALTYRIQSADRLGRLLKTIPLNRGSVFIEALCQTGARSDLGRPTEDPRQAKQAFMKFLNSDVASHAEPFVAGQEARPLRAHGLVSQYASTTTNEAR